MEASVAMATSFQRFLQQLQGIEAASISGFLQFSGPMTTDQVQALATALKESSSSGIRLAGKAGAQ